MDDIHDLNPADALDAAFPDEDIQPERLPTYPRLQAEMVGEAGRLAKAQKELSALIEGGNTPEYEPALKALACAHLLQPLDPTYEVPELQKALAAAAEGKLGKFAHRALRLVTSEAAIVQQALIGLQVLDMVGFPTQAEWDNLSPLQIARRVNRHAWAIRLRSPKGE